MLVHYQLRDNTPDSHFDDEGRLVSESDRADDS